MNDFSWEPVPFEMIQVGMSVHYSQSITDHNIKNFAGLSGDHNPVHVSDEFLTSSSYKKGLYAA
jgi:3-hydroxybutyryl-CoA dehydratase